MQTLAEETQAVTARLVPGMENSARLSVKGVDPKLGGIIQ